MDFFQRIGNLISGHGFISDNERKKKDQQQVQQQRQSSVQAPQQQNLPSFAQPQQQSPFAQNQQQNSPLQKPQNNLNVYIPGQNDQPLQKANPQPAQQPQPEQKPLTLQPQAPSVLQPQRPTVLQPLQKAPQFAASSRPAIQPTLLDAGKQLVSGVQQQGGNIADIALQGGAVLNESANQINPFISGAQREANTVANVRGTERMRNAIKNARTVTGESLNPNADYVPTGNAGQDIAQVAGRSLQTGLDVAGFLNPAAMLRGETPSLARTVARDATVYGTGQGTASGAQEYGQTGDLGDAVKTGLSSGAISGLSQGALEGAAGIAGRMRNTEIAPGVHSVNPNREAEFAAQTGLDQPTPPNPADEMQARMKQAADEAVVRARSEEVARQLTPNPSEVVSQPQASQLQSTAAQSANDINAAVPLQKVVSNAPDSAPIQQPQAPSAPVQAPTPVDLQSVPPEVQQAAEARAQAIDQNQANAAANDQAVVNDARMTAPVDNTPAPNTPADTSGEVSGARNNRFTQTAAAQEGLDPSVRAYLDQAIKDGGDVQHRADVENAALERVRAMSDQELVQNFSKTLGKGADNMAEAAVANKRLYALSKNPDLTPEARQMVQEAMKNAADTIASHSTESGRGIDLMKIAYKYLTPVQKAQKIVDNFSKLLGKGAKYEVSEPDRARLVGLIDQADSKQAEVDAIHQNIQDLQQRVASGESISKSDIKALNKQLAKANNENELAQGAVTTAAQDLMPKNRKNIGTRFGNYTRASMLMRPLRRVADVANTDVLGRSDNLTTNISAVAGKALNKVYGKGAARQQLTNPVGTALSKVKGIGKGLQKVTQGAYRSESYMDDILGAATGKSRSQLAPQSSFVTTAHNLANVATEQSRYRYDQTISSIADQRARQLGLTGDTKKNYVELFKASPDQAAQDVASHEWQVTNLIHDNKVSSALSTLSAAAEGKGGVFGSVIKNLTLPFARVSGGIIHRAITDFNPLYQAYQLGKGINQHDAQLIADSFAKGLVGTGGAVAATMAANSGILTNEDANGDKYNGFYIHLGDNYIPIPGTAAIPAAVGKFTSDVANGGDANKLADDTITGLTNATGAGNALGDNQLTREIGSVASGRESAGNAATNLGATVITQNIPGLTRDVNAALNTATGQDTLAVDTSGKGADGKVNSLKKATQRVEAALPGSPLFMAKNTDGKAAQNVVDTITGGNHSTTGQKQAVADAKKQQDISADFAKRDIPDPNSKVKGYSFDNAVETKIENGEFDKAREGLEADLKNKQSDKNMPPSKLKTIQDKITQLRIASENGLSYDDMKLYNSTTVSEWRNMGDSTKDTYDQATYDKLWSIDQKLADNGVAGGFKTVPNNNSSISDKQKYSEKKPSTKKSSGRGRGGSRGSLSDAAGGKISTPDIGKVSLGALKAQQATQVKIPTLQQVKPGELIKKREIKVTKG